MHQFQKEYSKLLDFVEQAISIHYETDLFADDVDEEKMCLEYIEILFSVWQIIYPIYEDRLTALTEKALKYSWGEDAFIRLNDSTLYLEHKKDGRSIDKFIAF